ncbi:MAG: HD domain-containing protein [bacterium]|nr:HD domain-containing protein [bacterium]
MSKNSDLNKNPKIVDFSSVAMVPGNPKYEQATSRITPIYTKNYDPRSPYERDLHRILHCTAYRRMKNKTQVFFATDNDHICTRIEHVSHVASISETIAKQLNLNLELVSAIAYGHDLGHAPFGHQGEYILDDIVKQYNIQSCFWHEANSLHFIDDIETLPDYHDFQRNMNLTYAVRDGIVCHCGELDEQVIKPRNDFIDLYDIQKGGKTHPFTYEGCIVKLADKIAYLGRDIEDALINKILTKDQIKELEHIIQKAISYEELQEVSITILTHHFIRDLCYNSSIEKGLVFSDECFELMNVIKHYNYDHICDHPRLRPFKKYARLIIETIFEKLDNYYGDSILSNMEKEHDLYPNLIPHFKDWLIKYTNIDLGDKINNHCKNSVVYDISSQNDYRKLIIDFISSMTDKYAIKIFDELIRF